MAEEKTEKATPKRKEDQRKEGNVFLGNEAIVVLSMAASFYGLKILMPKILPAVENCIRQFLQMGAQMDTVSADNLPMLFKSGCITFFIAAMPIMLICAIVPIALTLAQTKMMFSTKAFSFQAKRLNPLSGFKRMFSLKGIMALLKALVKILILGYIVYLVFKDELVTFPKLMDMPAEQAMGFTGDLIMTVVKKSVLVFAAVAAFDYFYQWWDYEKNLRMSKQEIKEEYKQTEGDPQIKGRIRDLQQQQARHRMMQNVKDADVVVRNPTHYAVAIRYQPERDNAPVVVAKGMDSLALRIVAEAEKHNVQTVENVPLARGLYQAVGLDEEIPEKYYEAVAEVLAFVYSLKKEGMKQHEDL